jgi:hypothetical protein
MCLWCVESEMAEDRNWMHSGWHKGGNYMDEWMDKATTFLDHAFLWAHIGGAHVAYAKI